MVSRVFAGLLCGLLASLGAGLRPDAHALRKWALNRVPGQVGEDLRAMEATITWDAVEFGDASSKYLPSNVTFFNLTIRDHGAAPAIVIERLHIDFKTDFWKPLPLDVTILVGDVKVSYKAYDLKMRDSNWARLQKRGFPPTFSSSTAPRPPSKTAKPAPTAAKPAPPSTTAAAAPPSSVRVKSVTFQGACSVAVEPCDAIGGAELRATVALDWETALRPLTEKINKAARNAEGGAIEPAALYAILHADLTKVVHDALVGAIVGDRQGTTKTTRGNKKFPFVDLPTTVSLGDTKISSLDSARRYLEGRISNRVSSTFNAAVKSTSAKLISAVGLDPTQSHLLENDIAQLFQQLAAPPPVQEEAPPALPDL